MTEEELGPAVSSVLTSGKVSIFLLRNLRNLRKRVTESVTKLFVGEPSLHRVCQ